MKEDLKKYRTDLIDTLRFLNESYDKLLVTLSGGALGISIAFLKDIVTLEKVAFPELLFLSWLAFIFSLACVLGRIMLGIEGYRKAISQVDQGTIHDSRPGGIYAVAARCLHFAAASLMLVGLLAIASFAYCNVGKSYVPTTTASTQTAP